MTSVLGAVEFEPVILAVDVYVVEHKNQWSVAGCQWPVFLNQA